MALHRQFNVDEGVKGADPSRGDVHYCIRITEKSQKEFYVPKLPPGTILVKHDNKIVKKPMESSINSLRKRLSQQITGHAPKCVNQPEKNKNSQVRRNSSRLSKKKIDKDFPRPRLLALRRGGAAGTEPDKERLKLSDVPYMNTRSVTKRLYNVGATLQVPNIQEEFEWREWPTHGMHERPIYHPQVGLAAEFLGRCFASFDGESYHEIPSNPDLEITPPLPRSHRKIPDREKMDERTSRTSFEDCMHRTFHSVLSYAASIASPEYRKIEERIVNSRLPPISIQPEPKKPQNPAIREKNPEKIPQPSSGPLDPAKPKGPKPPLNLICIKNHAKLQQVLGRGKNTLILLKTSDPNLKKEGVSLGQVPSVSSHPPQSERLDQKNSMPPEEKGSVNVKIQETKVDWEKETKEKEKSLKELIADTAVLYCTSMGGHQDDIVDYIDSLSPRECRNSLGMEL
ncbi:uncharacterized protein LOC135169971 [Diachasmimorpha longicaudata]|uniref:uncharacterized protein LOC135169971 n=1 Tax=Diachasmimorpha longicaudata TaxID=58733 RepID=UPI0030B885BA